MSDGSLTPDDRAATDEGDRGELDSDELIAWIVEYDEALAAGHTLDFTQEESVRRLPSETRERLFGIFECLEFLDRVRRAKAERGSCDGGSEEAPRGRTAGEPPEGGTAKGGTAKGGTERGAGSALTIGRFEVVRELGRGGHGVVFLANDPLLRRRVALKVPRPEFLLSASMSRRFLGEARAAAALDHPNILKVYEVGSDGAIGYIAQELCTGPSLAEWLRERAGKVDPRLAAEIVTLLARGVEHAHQAGVLHRDLKPANVLLQPVGRQAGSLPYVEQAASLLGFVPKLADFGIAKVFHEESDRTTTLTGTAIGTVAYMSPEQAAGNAKGIGPPSDVYGLGAILYELLTGGPPFEVESGTGVMETLQRVIVAEPTRPRALRSDLPAELEAICLKCLEKSPADRYATAGTLAADLERFLNGESVSVRPAGRVRRMARRLRRQPLSMQIGGAMIALLVGALGVCMAVIWASRGAIVGQSPGPPPNPGAEYLDGIEHVAQGYFDAVANRGDVKSAVRELDTFLERHRPQPGVADYRGFEWHYLWRMCHPDQVAKPFPKLFDLVGHKGEVYCVTFSPDGRRLASAGQDHTGRIWDATTGKLLTTLVGHTDEVNWVSFYPHAANRYVLTASDDKTVRVWDCESGKAVAVLSGHESKVVAAELAVVERHHGDHTQREYEIISGDHAGRLLIWDANTLRQLRVIPAHGGRIEALAPSRGREWWITASEDGTATEWNGATWTPMRTHVVDSADSGGSHPSIVSVSCNTEATLAAFGWGRGAHSGHGSFAPSTNAAGSVLGGAITIDDLLTGARWLSLTGPGLEANECVRFVPGQCALASTCRDDSKDGGGDHDVVYWDLPTQKFWKPFAGSHPPSWCAAFSPDGTRMATAGNDGIVRVWDSSMLPGGTRLNSLDGIRERPPGTMQFSPDGRRLLVTYLGTSGPERGHSFVVWDVSGERPKLTYSESARKDFDGSYTACFSRDGRFIALETRTRSGQGWNSCIRRLDADSLREIGRLDGFDDLAQRVLLSPNGENIVAVTSDAKGQHPRLNVWQSRQPARPVYARDSVPPIDFLATTLSPDGKLLVTNRGGLEFYEFPSLRLIETLPGDLGPSPVARFSSDGRLLAASGKGGTIHLWDAHARKELTALRSDGHAVLSLAFSPDGTRLAAGLDGASRVDLWHVPTGRRLTSLAMPSDLTSVTDLSFSPDGRTLAAASRDLDGFGGVFLFPFKPVGDAAGPVRHSESGAPSREN